MMVLTKLIIAHFIGDFVLQPKSWVEDKESKKGFSPKLYLHLLIHGILVLLILWNLGYWLLALVLMLFHGVIDVAKLYAQKETTRPLWFLIDQSLHLISILIIWYLWFDPEINFTEWIENPIVWIYTAAILFITIVSAIVIQVLISSWSKTLNDSNDQSLSNAGKYIGMLERMFVFTFVVTGNWQAIGFLLAAKSVFRFGDLRESKDRKLTEYILIGTLLSFGIAIATGLIVLSIIDN